MNYLTDTTELAKKAGIGDSHGYIIANEIKNLEAFRNLCIRAHMDKLIAECGVEPVAYLDLQQMTPSSMVYATGFQVLEKQTGIYTADQLAAAVARTADKYDGLMEDHQALSFENIENIRKLKEIEQEAGEYALRHAHMSVAMKDNIRRILQLETDLEEQCRLNGMGSEREAKLLTRIVELETQLDALKPKEVKRVCGKGGLCYHQPDCSDIHCSGRGAHD